MRRCDSFSGSKIALKVPEERPQVPLAMRDISFELARQAWVFLQISADLRFLSERLNRLRASQFQIRADPARYPLLFR